MQCTNTRIYRTSSFQNIWVKEKLMDSSKGLQEKLAMHEPAIMSLPPDSEIFGFTIVVKPGFEKELLGLIAELTEKHTSFPTILIFWQTYMDRATMYQSVWDCMAAQFLEPTGFPKFLHQFRMADMYHTAMRGLKGKGPLGVHHCWWQTAADFCNKSIWIVHRLHWYQKDVSLDSDTEGH